MRMKTVVSASIPEAMDLIHNSLGAAAVIISSQRQPDGRIRLIGALPYATSDMDLKKALGRQETPNQNTVIQLLLKRHGVSESLTRHVLHRLQQGFQLPTEDVLASAWEQLLTFTQPLERIRFLMGPPASGKTTALLKQVVADTLAKKPATVITLDKRPGSVEHLTAFCSLLKVPVLTAETAAEVSFLVRRISPDRRIYVDTTGQLGKEKTALTTWHELAANLSDAVAELTVSLGLNASEALAQVKPFLVFRQTVLIGTFADSFHRLGCLLNIAYRLQIPLAALMTDAMETVPLISLTAESLSDRMRQPLLLKGGLK